MKYELEDRIVCFSKNIILLIREIRFECKIYNKDLDSLLNQLFRSSTSIAANYMEATNAISKNDFKNKIAIAKKEAKETGYWIDILFIYVKDKKVSLEILLKESKEINLILSSIFNKLRI